MEEHRLATTKNRSVIGIMNEFSYLADVFMEANPFADLEELSMDLSETPCGPLFKRHVTPHDELKPLVAERSS